MYRIVALILKPYAAILFLENRVAGAVLLGLTLLHPAIGISGIFALFSTILFAEFTKMRQAYLEHGFYLYNSLLVGMGIGYLFSPTPTSFVLIFLLSVMTFLLSFTINTLFAPRMIPTLSLPFSIVTVIAYLAAFNYAGLVTSHPSGHLLPHIELPAAIGSYFRALGTVFFLPGELEGIVMAALLFALSRIMFLLSLIGFYTGTAIHALLIGSWGAALADPYGFNYLLVSMALGGVFLVPMRNNYLLALLGVALSVVFVDATQVFFRYYAIPVFTLPFNTIVMSMLFLLGTIGYESFNHAIKSTPEESLSYYLQTLFRFGPRVPNIALPFTGTWSVYQGFDGPWTHKGAWRHAYDFIIEKAHGSYKNEGNLPEDYYCFGESIVAPVNGFVVACRGDLPDNPIGTVDRINNWGNYLILRSDEGFFVEMSHLMQHSLRVKEGDYVHIGQIVAKCGNSGYSPQPHIHIQVQKAGYLGSATVPFRFGSYRQEKRLFFHSLPPVNAKVSALLPSPHLQMQFGFVLDEEFRFDRYERGKYMETVRWKVEMNHMGEFYLGDGENRLYFHTTPTLFYFYHYEGGESPLKKLFTLAPKIPLTMAESLHYRDYLPLYLLETGFRKALTEFLASFQPERYRRGFDYRMTNLSIHSSFGSVVLAVNQKGFGELRYKETVLRRQP
ncbi:urea transporter [Hydrogenimonas sp.]